MWHVSISCWKWWETEEWAHGKGQSWPLRAWLRERLQGAAPPPPARERNVRGLRSAAFVLPSPRPEPCFREGVTKTHQRVLAWETNTRLRFIKNNNNNNIKKQAQRKCRQNGTGQIFLTHEDSCSISWEQFLLSSLSVHMNRLQRHQIAANQGRGRRLV